MLLLLLFLHSEPLDSMKKTKNRYVVVVVVVLVYSEPTIKDTLKGRKRKRLLYARE